MRSEDVVEIRSEEVEPVRLRSYQQEMLEESLRRNVIVVMDTGSGKTHVAVSRMRVQLEKTGTDRLVWFISPSVALTLQQYDVLHQHLGAYLVKTLIGRDGVDKWSDQRIWDAALTNVRVVVGTPAVLADALTHGFVSISRLSLIVFDEAHRCIKDSPMNQIMRNFYHPAKEAGRVIPHILGLTASPVMNAKAGSLEKIEANMDSVAVTPKIHRSELNRYVHPPELIHIGYQEDETFPIPRLMANLLSAVENYKFAEDPYAVELASLGDHRSMHKLMSLLTNKKATYTFQQLKDLKQRSETLQTQLGALAADWYIRRCLDRFKEGREEISMYLPNITEREHRHLAGIFDLLLVQSGPPLAEVSKTTITEKAQKLIKLLIREATPEVRGIIFVEQRATVVALAQLLRSSSELQEHYSIGMSVGFSTSESRTKNVSDLSNVRAQEKDLADFREGRKNLMIATNVLEEGIDVNACNLVICFDPPVNLVSFVQRRGRARQRASKYIIFLSTTNPKGQSQKWQLLEAAMKEAYMADRDEAAPVDPEDEEKVRMKVHRIESTGALLTLANAKAHLYHFCAVGSRHTRYVDLRPEFSMVIEIVDDGDGPRKIYTASVTLPTFVHRDFRTASGTTSWYSEAAAIQDAAFEAYLKLLRAGLVNDHLLPLVKDYGPDEGDIHIDQPSIVQVRERKSSWQMVFDKGHKVQADWVASKIQIRKGNQDYTEILMWIPFVLPRVTKIPLYWNETTVYEIIITPTSSIVRHDSERVLSNMRDFTYIMWNAVHGTRMPAGKRDFLVLFSTGSKMFDDEPNGTLGGLVDAQDLFGTDFVAKGCGLVRTTVMSGNRFIFSCFTTTIDHETNEELHEVSVTKFPKRTDFLHPVQVDTVRKDAYTGRQQFPLSSCTVDALPLRFAVASALLPSVLHHVDVFLLAQVLQTTVLSEVCIQDTALVLEAISAPMSNPAEDYNRLEFLGDCLLKFFTVVQVSAQHLTWPEGYLGVEKFRIVSNNNLARYAQEVGLDRYILGTSFTGKKWQPLYMSDMAQYNDEGVRSMSSKVLADVVEALIGASYMDGGLGKAYQCVRKLLRGEMWLDERESIDRLLSEVGNVSVKDLQLLERLIGHKFKRPALLVEAITHASLPYNHEGISYERLEFLGDAVLDVVLIPQAFTHESKLKHWELHRLQKALVNADYLGFCCMNYAIEQVKHDIVSGTGRHVEVKDGIHAVALHDFLRASSEVYHAKQQAIEAFEKYRGTVSDALEKGSEYPWTDLIAMGAPKFLSDMVESVLGALYLDSEGDLSVCSAFVEKLGILRHMRRFLSLSVETLSPKERIGVLAGTQTVKYDTSKAADESGEKRFACSVSVGEQVLATVKGCNSAQEAEARAARSAASAFAEGYEGVSQSAKTKLG